MAVLRKMGLREGDTRVTPWGGATALGHPPCAGGARLVTSAFNELHRFDGRNALCAMCIGVEHGIAVVLERV